MTEMSVLFVKHQVVPRVDNTRIAGAINMQIEHRVGGSGGVSIRLLVCCDVMLGVHGVYMDTYIFTGNILR